MPSIQEIAINASEWKLDFPNPKEAKGTLRKGISIRCNWFYIGFNHIKG